MKTKKELAKAYINTQYIYYGDLNESEEKQIKDAFIAGFNSGKKHKKRLTIAFDTRHLFTTNLLGL